MTPRTARAIATAACHRLTAESIFFRSTKSAMAPAGNVKREEGSAESVAMSGRSSVESDLAREFRTQKAAVPWAAIALPEIRFASQNLLKAGFRKAVQVDILVMREHLRIQSGLKLVNPSAREGRLRAVRLEFGHFCRGTNIKPEVGARIAAQRLNKLAQAAVATLWCPSCCVR